jgi:hypothetical protein
MQRVIKALGRRDEVETSGLIDVLLDAGGQLPRNELAVRAGLTSNAGTFGTYLSRLRSNDLVSVAGSVVRIADALYG